MYNGFAPMGVKRDNGTLLRSSSFSHRPRTFSCFHFRSQGKDTLFFTLSNGIWKRLFRSNDAGVRAIKPTGVALVSLPRTTDRKVYRAICVMCVENSNESKEHRGECGFFQLILKRRPLTAAR